MGTAIKHPMPGQVKPPFVIFDAQDWASECPDVKNYNDGLTQSAIGCFIVVPIWQLWVSKG